MLDTCGLRSDRKPTPLAIDKGFAMLVENGFGQVVFWHIEKTKSALRSTSAAETPETESPSL
jgi:hypothetical protein